MNKAIYMIFSLLVLISVSCASTSDTNDKPEVGAKNGACYSDFECNSGLICIDQICKDDPCYQVKCDEWKECISGTCELSANRCEEKADCSNATAYCDVHYNCIVEENPCEYQTCSGNGKCLLDVATKEPICTCITGYNNKTNPLTCIKDEVVDLCENSNCDIWEECNSTNGDCDLISGKCGTNDDCSGDKICDNHNCVDPADPCIDIDCGVYGSCVVDNDLLKCLCDTNEGYYPDGLTCKNPCVGHESCGGFGICKSSSATDAICDCRSTDGYKAHPTELICIEDTAGNLCEGNSCGSWEPCDISTGACVLPEGKCNNNTNCESTDKLTCSDHTCINLCETYDCNGQDCTATASEATCDCDTGYTGTDCKTCADGYQENGELCEPYTIWCNLQSPTTINQEKDSLSELVYARVYVGGEITESTTESSIIKAQLGYITGEVSLPINDSNYTWLNAGYNTNCGDCGNNDEYMASFPTNIAGDFKYIYRFSIDNEATWLYCDLNGVGGIGSDPFEVNQVGLATITEPVSTITELFISEYIEGGGYNKAIEIYNGTTENIDLSNYSLKLATNGADWGKELTLSTTIISGDVFVIISNHNEVVQELKDEADKIVIYSSDEDITMFSGDDAVGLFKNGTLIDIIGTPTNRTVWEVAGVSNATQDHTLLRKSTIENNNVDWTSSSGTNTDDSEWIVMPKDDYSNLGSFTPIE